MLVFFFVEETSGKPLSELRSRTSCVKIFFRRNFCCRFDEPNVYLGKTVENLTQTGTENLSLKSLLVDSTNETIFFEKSWKISRNGLENLVSSKTLPVNSTN